MIKPVGYRVLIKPDKVEEKSKGGIIINTIDAKREQAAQVIGEVVAVGDYCWTEYEAPWAKVGDKVYYQKYSGMSLPNDQDHILLNDTDITGVVTND